MYSQNLGKTGGARKSKPNTKCNAQKVLTKINWGEFRVLSLDLTDLVPKMHPKSWLRSAFSCVTARRRRVTLAVGFPLSRIENYESATTAHGKTHGGTGRRLVSLYLLKCRRANQSGPARE